MGKWLHLSELLFLISTMGWIVVPIPWASERIQWEKCTSSISAVLSTEKAQEKERALVIITVTTSIPKTAEEGPDRAQGIDSGQKGPPRAGDRELWSHTFLSSGSASLWLCVTLGKLLRLN